jgi:hypothetical protein
VRSGGDVGADDVDGEHRSPTRKGVNADLMAKQVA